MKMKKFAWAFMTAFVSLAMVFTGCKSDAPSDPSDPSDPSQPSDPSDPSQPSEPEEEEIEFPEVSAPEAGTAKIVVKVPAGTDCNGVAFKGSNDGYNAHHIDVAGEAIEGAAGWYEIVLELGEAAIIAGDAETFYQGKVCLYKEDGTVDDSYTTQWSEGYFEINADNGNPDLFALIEDFGKINKLAVLGEGVCYIVIDRFDANPCVANEGYSFSLALPALCDEADQPGLIGSFPASNWGTDVDLEFNGERWIAEDVEAQAANEWKIRLNHDWGAGQLQKVDAETGSYNDLANEPFGEDLEIVREMNEAEGYAWSPCAGM